MATALDITESAIIATLGGALRQILPANAGIVLGQVNRVPSPVGPTYVVMTPISRIRLATNVTRYGEAVLEGSITGDVLTVTAVLDGAVSAGTALAGDGVAAYSSIVAALGGPPGAELYRIAPAQTVAQGLIFAGGVAMMQPTEVTIQLDAHGPESPDYAQRISTVLRSAYGCDLMAQNGLGVVPLYTSDPHQMGFRTGEDQTDNRWTLDAVLQANLTVTAPQQFAGAVEIGLIEVDERYPP
jgi:hypothetical protein